jgi:hypothetical protein
VAINYRVHVCILHASEAPPPIPMMRSSAGMSFDVSPSSSRVVTTSYPGVHCGEAKWGLDTGVVE